MKKVIHNIRDFFWPMLEDQHDNADKVTNVSSVTITIADENLEEALKQQVKVFEGEEDRRKSIESKASLFISTISVANSIVVAANALITGNHEYNLPIKISVSISFILSIYAVRTVWFSIKALERKSYMVLDLKDINVPSSKSDFYKHLINVIEHKIINNQEKINEKVDYFTLAQEYYKRAIILICMYSFLILLFCFFLKGKPEQDQKALQINKIEYYDSIKH